jgi:hypothetical protein
MTTDAEPAAVSGPPFPLDRPTSASWREQALSKIAELRFVRDWLEHLLPPNSISPEAAHTIEDHLTAAKGAAVGGTIWRPRNFVAAITGSGVERVTSQLDAVEGELLRIAPPEYLCGEIFGLLAHVELHLHANDPRRVRLEDIAARVVRSDGAAPTQGEPVDGQPCELSPSDRQAVVSAVRAASSESRWKVSRLRSFRNVILIASLLLALGAAGTIFFAFHKPSDLPICFTPANVVCATSTTYVPPAERQGASGAQTARSQASTDQIMRRAASPWDVVVVELVGLVAAAIAAAASVRNVQGTSTPYSLPVALAVLKLPTGALTALLGLLLMRGGFVPGLSALDSSSQIIAWALVFGYAQQLLTRFVDSQAQTVLQGAGGDAKSLAPATATTSVSHA